MTADNDRFKELMDSFRLAKDLRKAKPEDSDKVALALSLKLNQSLFTLDIKDSARHLLDRVQAKIDERIAEVCGADRSKERIELKCAESVDFRFFIHVALRAKKKINDLIEYVTDDEPDDFALELVEFVLEALDEYNSVIVNDDVIPLIKRGVYASDIAEALKVWGISRTEMGGDERFWHGELESRKGVLERLLGGHAVLLRSEFHAGATDISGAGSIRADFAFLNKSRNISLIEIKSPDTNLLGSKYRGTYPLSKDLSGAVSQVLIQRSELMMNYYMKRNQSPEIFEVFAPRCFLIVGDLSSVSDDRDKLRAFEVQRQAIASHVTIVTFDELYEQFSSFNLMDNIPL
ncbi:Shedu immune nuclease family protein [Pseudomonas tussilaginis]|uniref:Shedu immune nuclease family protein n=1 Tax=Pseudomonas sp. 5 TaxID=1619949 RepID=UPI0009E2CB9F|nr:Shedu immune nuclease family protein [Pseudomonas sp. 5]